MLQPARFSFCFKRCHIPKKKHFFLPRWKLHTHKVSHPFFIKVCWKPKKKKKRKMKTRRKQQPARSTGRLLRELGAGWWHCSMIVWWYYLLWRLVCRGWNLHLAKRRKSWDSYHQLRAPQNPPLGSWAWCSVKMLLPTPWTEAQRAAGCTPGKKHLPGMPAAQQSKPHLFTSPSTLLFSMPWWKSGRYRVQECFWVQPDTGPTWELETKKNQK